jgi:hypothetical protein
MSPGTALARALTALAALLVAGWLAVGLRSAVLEERGKDRVIAAVQFTEPKQGEARPEGPLIGQLLLKDPTPVQARRLRRAARDLDRATWLNPDGALRIHHAQALVLLGEKARARRIAHTVTVDHREDIDVWRTAEAIALGLPDRALLADARRHIRELNPRLASR